MIEARVTLVSNEDIGPRLFKMVLECEGIAKEVQPGQFVHMKLNGADAHILRRPISVYKTDPEKGTFELIVQVIGKGTAFLHDAKVGAEFDVLGPVGHGWQIVENAHRVLIVGGGVGAAPLFIFTEKTIEAGVDRTVILGAQTKAALVTLQDYTDILGVEPLCATDDGSYGTPGFCTGLVEQELANGGYDAVYVCGPEPLMKIVASIAAKYETKCFVSMEKRMACGVGACLSCVVDTVDGKLRSCVDGPVFDAQKVVW